MKWKKKRYVFLRLREKKFFSEMKNKRILEIGPRHGKDSFWLATLEPSELVILELPSKNEQASQWLSELEKKVNLKYYEGNFLYLEKNTTEQMGKYDLVWCTGVLYHNDEQLRFLKKIYDLCNINGRVVIESEITNNKKLQKLNVVEIHWPRQFDDVPTITHLPSPLAIKSWLEMVGFSDVMIQQGIISKYHSRKRAVITAVKTSTSSPYVSYKSNKNPIYFVGDSI